MPTLRTGGNSPFGRKARIAVKVLGLEGKVALAAASTVDPADPIRQQNPLGKVPVLLLDDGGALYDSPVILEYLDYLAGGGRIIPPEPQARFAALRLEALADGIMDASILINYEARYRPPEKHEAKWLELQGGKVARALAVLEAAPSVAIGTPPDVGAITLACALGYRDFRFPGSWRGTHPRLAAWLDDFAARVPAYAATTPPG
jgi:glutathione S-transferase